MKKINWKKLSVSEVGAIISDYLAKCGFKLTLTGGACVSIYSNNRYRSADLDFVMPMYDLSDVDGAMSELGFERTKGHRHYVNDECSYYVEFPPPPLSIGEEVVTNVSEIKNKYGVLKLLTPTDCVKDRLAAFYHWNDRQSLAQAVMVAKDQKVDMKNIKQWSKNEMSLNKFNEFLKLLR